VVTAILGVCAAGFGALTAYFGFTKADVVQQRDDVQSHVSTLATRQSTLKERVAKLTRENADLRQQLQAAATDSGTTSTAPSDVVTRSLTAPLPDQGSAMGLFLDEGRVSADCCGADFNYQRQDATGRPELVSHNGSPYSTAVESATVSQDACSRAVTTSPTIRAIRPLHSGLLICALTSGGTSLLQIVAAPQKDGTLKLSQRFWPNP
jgi:hypothetical protein